MTIDLLTERWIPVLYGDGRQEEVGLRDALATAHEIVEIRDPLPTVEFGLYRLLVALVHDIFAPDRLTMLNRLLDAGCFDPTALDAYWTRYADRFDLFHPAHPFLQTGGMEREEVKPLAGLLAAIPSGTNAVHFHHATETEFGVGPASAARLLTTLAPFMTAGGTGLSPSINGAPPWYALVTGETLFDTLCLNTCVMLHEALRGDSLPAWRNDHPPAAGRVQQAALLEGLTWRPRRIQLIPGPGGRCALTGREEPVLVRAMRFTAGASVNFVWHDPNVAYRVTDKGRFPLRPQEDRELWRDTGPLALLREEDYILEKGSIRFTRPQVVEQAVHLEVKYFSDDMDLNLIIYGMRTDMNMKVFEWRRERLSIPAGVAREGFKCGDAQTAMDTADKVAHLLRQSIRQAYPRKGEGNTDAFATRASRATRRFWDSLKSPYDALLRALAHLPADDTYTRFRDEALTAWETDLRREGWRALDDALDDLDTDADAMRRVVEARQYFQKKLGAALPRLKQRREAPVS